MPTGPAELVVVLVILLLLFGARKLPELAGAMGKSVRSFRKGVTELDQDDDDAGGPAPSPDGDEVP